MNDKNDALKSHATHPSVRRRVEQLKQRLFRWIQQNCFSADATAVNVALLEIALEGYLVMSESEEDTRAFMNDTLQRIVHKPSGPVQ